MYMLSIFADLKKVSASNYKLMLGILSSWKESGISEGRTEAFHLAFLEFNRTHHRCSRVKRKDERAHAC